jgi:hypothetical protein
MDLPQPMATRKVAEGNSGSADVDQRLPIKPAMPRWLLVHTEPMIFVHHTKLVILAQLLHQLLLPMILMASHTHTALEDTTLALTLPPITKTYQFGANANTSRYGYAYLASKDIS